MLVNSSASSQDTAASLQTLLQGSKQNSAAKTAKAAENETALTVASSSTTAETSQLFSPLETTGEGADLSETDAAQLTDFLSKAMLAQPAAAQSAQANQIPQSVLSLLQ